MHKWNSIVLGTFIVLHGFSGRTTDLLNIFTAMAPTWDLECLASHFFRMFKCKLAIFRMEWKEKSDK